MFDYVRSWQPLTWVLFLLLAAVLFIGYPQAVEFGQAAIAQEEPIVEIAILPQSEAELAYATVGTLRGTAIFFGQWEIADRMNAAGMRDTFSAEMGAAGEDIAERTIRFGILYYFFVSAQALEGGQ